MARSGEIIRTFGSTTASCSSTLVARIGSPFFFAQFETQSLHSGGFARIAQQLSQAFQFPMKVVRALLSTVCCGDSVVDLRKHVVCLGRDERIHALVEEFDLKRCLAVSFDPARPSNTVKELTISMPPVPNLGICWNECRATLVILVIRPSKILPTKGCATSLTLACVSTKSRSVRCMYGRTSVR